MIIPNGTIEVQNLTGGGLDPETGFPTTGAATWDEPVPCQFSPVKQDYRATVDGEPAKTLSFSILIEQQPSFKADRLRLQDSAGTLLREFSVESVEQLEAVGQTRIIV